jgi:hypothetical protein
LVDPYHDPPSELTYKQVFFELIYWSKTTSLKIWAWSRHPLCYILCLLLLKNYFDSLCSRQQLTYALH